MQALQQSNLYSDKQTQGCFVWIHDSVCVCVCHFMFAVRFGRVGVYVCHYTWSGGNVNQKMQPRQMLTFILFMIDKPLNHMFV